VGAQSLQECLLLQLRYLCDEDSTSEDSAIRAIAERLVRDHFDHIGAHRYAKLARAVGIPIEEVKQAVEFIRTRLNPFPASQFRPPWAYRPTNSKATVRPDVVIRRTEFGYEVDVLGTEGYALSVNPLYRDIYTQVKNGQLHQSEDDKKHFTEYVERAELFIRNINQRRQSLRQITRCIIDCQIGFMETGSRQFLRPLTRTRIARVLNIHESTVSRATANKYVQLPNQEVVSYHVFFNSSLSIKDAIEAIIQEEDPASPFSDQQIMQLLTAKGIHVARRTIVKYRESQKILSSTRRRR
jgi:RNA polymerase sigma-54 factor